MDGGTFFMVAENDASMNKSTRRLKEVVVGANLGTITAKEKAMSVILLLWARSVKLRK